MPAKSFKVYSLDYLKQKQYSDNTTEDATRLECAGLAIGMVEHIKEQGLLHLTDTDISKLKAAIFFAIVNNTPLGDAYINDELIVIDSQENEYVAGIPVTPPTK
jgi:hypothetical protein